MHNKHVKIALGLFAVLVFAVMIFISCSKPGFEGIAETNKAPKCYISNIPTEGTEYSQNPTLFWFATDADGFIQKYRYTVKTKAEVNGDPLAYAEEVLLNEDYDDWTVIYTDSLTPGKSATSDTIQLYAVADPTIYTEQYFFVQAVDNHGLASMFTDTVKNVDGVIQSITPLAYRMYSRNNNPPDTHLSFDEEKTYFSLPDTTAQYQGVIITWSGSDSLDYKRTQPPFQYHWEVFGPFATYDEANDDPSKLIFESWDSTTQSVWVDIESATLFDLYRHEPAATTTRSDYFMFKVRARDDAFVPDPTPSTTVFYAVEPGFEKDILIVDANTYIAQYYVLKAAGTRALPDDANIMKFQDYYKNLFTQAGYPADSLFWFYNAEQYVPHVKAAPELDEILKYKFILHVYDNARPLNLRDANFYDKYSDYLDLGGKLMMVGWNHFSVETKGIQRFGPSDFAYKYFGVTAEYYTHWSFDDFNTIGPNKGNTPEEFIYASAIVDDLPNQLGTDLDGNMRDYFVVNAYWDKETLKNNYPFKSGAEPWVNYYIKSISAEATYTAKSFYSDYREFERLFSSSSIDGKVCGVRMKNDVFRTAVYAFSLYSMPEAEAVEFIKANLDWFFAPDEED